MLTVPMNDEEVNFTRILPAMMLYADGRIYRDMTFLATRTTQPVQLTAKVREFVLPPTVIALRSINVITPVGAVTNTSKRKLLERISPEALDYFWPQASFQPSVPQKYAVVGDQPGALVPPSPPDGGLQHLVRLMPEPDQAYYAELFGDIRPAPLSAKNPTTYLSVFYPELFICACMIFGTGYQRDFGAQSDDPQRAVSWEGQYAYLKNGIMPEAARMRGEVLDAAAQPKAP